VGRVSAGVAQAIEASDGYIVAGARTTACRAARLRVRPDLVVENALVVEAIDHLAAIHHAQLLTYLRPTGYPAGLLIDVNVELLKHGVTRRLKV
jgi:hypothetical protein